MSATARQAWRFAELLGTACGVEVTVACSGRPGGGTWGGWVVQWSDGPTEAEMRGIAAAVLPAAGGSGSTAAELSYCRRLSAFGDATALLVWLRRHSGAAEVSAVSLVAARDEVSYPERADAATLRRARTLLGRSPSGTVSYDLLRELAGHARGGVEEVQRWLDDVDRAATGVVDLAAERARRRYQ